MQKYGYLKRKLDYSRSYIILTDTREIRRNKFHLILVETFEGEIYPLVSRENTLAYIEISDQN